MPKTSKPWVVRTVDAAKELGIDPPSLIYKIEHGIIPIGHVIRKGSCKKADVTIYRKRLDEYKAANGIP